ncbi:13537_t:CDS:2, partial [Gigaspora margarita]
MINRIIPVVQRKFFTTINEKELEQLKQARYEKENQVYQRNSLILDFLFYMGLRVSELVNIRHCDYQDKSLKVYGKGNKIRYIPVPDFLVKYFNSFCQDYLFTTKNKKRLNPIQIRIMIYKKTKKAGIEKHISPHTFRRSFATLLNNIEVRLTTIQKLLGHRSIETTTGYIHNSYEEIYKDYIGGVAVILVALGYGYKIKVDRNQLTLKKNDREHEKKHKHNETRICELEKKNGHEQRQIDEQRKEINDLKDQMAKVKDLSDKVETGQDKILNDLNNLSFPEGYAPIYKKFSDLLDEDYLTKIIITSRGTGKSHNVKSSLEPWRKILNKYCFEYTQEKISIKDFEEVWEAITRGIKYKGVMRLHFIELYKSEDARELLDG